MPISEMVDFVRSQGAGRARSCHDRRELGASRLAIRASGHEGHRFDPAETLVKSPAQQASPAFQVHAAAFIRPTLHAAIDLGAETVWPTLERAMALGLEDWARIARRVVPDADERNLLALGRAVRRTMLGAMLDKTVTPAELREELRALIVGEPVGLRRKLARTA